jgi:hypothetical protein
MTLWHSLNAVRFVDRGVAQEDRKEADGIDYTEQRVRLSIVHTREDVMLMAYHLANISSSLWWIKICVVLTTFLYVIQPLLKQRGWT